MLLMKMDLAVTTHMRRDTEALVTAGTLEGLLSRVGSQMLLQMSIASAQFAAHCTPEGPGVNIHMLFQSCCGEKCFPAQRANLRLGLFVTLNMGSLMLGEILIISQGFPAFGTFQRFLSGVPAAHVHYQRGVGRERLRALRAAVRTLPRVSSHMSSQLTSLGKAFQAHVTTVRLCPTTAAVHFHMAREMRLVGKRLVAFGTLVPLPLGVAELGMELLLVRLEEGQLGEGLGALGAGKGPAVDSLVVCQAHGSAEGLATVRTHEYILHLALITTLWKKRQGCGAPTPFLPLYTFGKIRRALTNLNTIF